MIVTTQYPPRSGDEGMAVLDAVQERVFLDRYALKGSDGQPLERTPDDMWRRVAAAIASVEPTPALERAWAERFEAALRGFRFVPGGRILSGAGSGHAVTLFNCLPPDQEVLTAAGYRRIADIQPGDEVVTHRGRLRRVLHRFEREADEPIFILHPRKLAFDAVRVTGEHPILVRRANQWNDGAIQGEAEWVKARDLRPGDFVATTCLQETETPPRLDIDIASYLPDGKYETSGDRLDMPELRGERGRLLTRALRYPVPRWVHIDEDLMYLFGVWLGDGCVTYRAHSPTPVGIQIAFHAEHAERVERCATIIERVFGVRTTVARTAGQRCVWLWASSMPLGEFFESFFGKGFGGKRIPSELMCAPEALLRALLRGLFHADGCVSGDVAFVQFSNRTLAIQVHQILMRLGYLFNIGPSAHVQPGQPSYRVIAARTECPDLVRDVAGQDLPARRLQRSYGKADGLSWVRVQAVEQAPYRGTVFDLEVEEDHSFITAGVVVSNCFVLPSPEDSRAGILDNLKLLVEIMARGGGVGVNLSSLRPRGSYIRTVNGTSSGPCAWAELYSVATGDVIQQGGSRRGALMLMLDDWHPDIEEFITVKTDLRRLLHANLSVCISDAFMQAVKDDADWPLVWQGEVKKVARAGALWDRICTAAWQSAEPGLVFIDRVNQENNLGYCETIRCCNPSLRAGTRVLTRDGILPIEELEGRDFLVKNLDGQWSPAHCFLSGRNKRLWKVTLANGVDVYATAEHKWPVALKGGGFAKTTTSRLQPGNFLPYPMVGNPGAAGTLGLTRDQGFMLGWLYGDGWIVTRSDNGQTTFGFLFSRADRPLADRVLATVNKMKGGGSTLCEGKDGTCSFQVTSRAFGDVLLNEWGVRDKAAGLPRCVWIASEEFRQGFIDGLLSADGSVTYRPPRIALSTMHRKLAEDFAELMSFYGIKSAVQSFRNNRSRYFPNGKDDVRTYSQHQVNFDFHRAAQFAGLFRLSHEEKQRRLRCLAERTFARKPYDVGLIRVVAVEETELHEDVWDISVADDSHCFQIGHCVTGNCGEEPLPPFHVCNLGALNLAAFVRDGQLDARALSETTRVAVRFLDNVIDATPYFLPENEAAQKGVRRVGLGTMGLADALIALGVRYGSDESLVVIEELYRTVRDAAYDASADLAAEKGPFPKFDRERFLERPFIQRLPETIRAKIAAHGIRNGTLLCQPPTGTTSLLAGVSSGIEPVYDFRLVRRDRLGEHVIEHPAYRAWRQAHPSTPLPPSFVTAGELTPEEHVRVQAKIQEYTDASISKTTNAPKTHTVEEVKRLYQLAYELGCKGITYYRDGSRPAVLSHAEGEQATANGLVRRPRALQGTTYRTETPLGTAFVTVNTREGAEGREPFEVFLNVGKAGSDIAALAEAIGRLCSLCLRLPCQLPARQRVAAIVGQLGGIGGGRALGFGARRVRSLPDAVARVLAEAAELDDEMAAHQGAPPAGADDLCPSCGEATLVHREGCRSCPCGFSEC